MNKNIQELLKFISLYAALFLIYQLLDTDIPQSYKIVCYLLLLCASFLSILPYYFFSTFRIRHFLPEFVLGACYSSTQAILAYFTPNNDLQTSVLIFDISSGSLIFTSLAFLRCFYTKLISSKYLKFANIVYICLLFLLTLPIILNIINFVLFRRPLTINAAQAILQTNIYEAAEYMANLPLSIQILTPILLLTILYALSKSILTQNLQHTFRRQHKIFPVLAFVCSLIVISYTVCIFPEKTATLGAIINAQKYFTSIEKFKTNRKPALQELQLTPNNPANRPHTIILVIGESATRDYMKAFMPTLAEDTTPWLSKMQHDNNIFLYKKAYSCAHATVPTLEHALTEANYYNNKPFNESLSIIDIAKKAGYKTYWFSHQGKIGPYDTPITMVAETADVTHWEEKAKYDDCLLPYLETVDKNADNFIVLHLYGSHAYYNNRYPANFQKWTDPGEAGKVADYKNSLLYTDYLLHKIYQYGTEKLNMDAMIYLSDHGATPGVERDPDSAPFMVLRIPLFIYLSPAYQQEHVQVTQTLKSNTDQYFTNDLLYNLICGIFDIKSNHYNEEESLASPSYKLKLEDLKTDSGKKMVRDDPYIAK